MISVVMASVILQRPMLWLELNLKLFLIRLVAPIPNLLLQPIFKHFNPPVWRTIYVKPNE
jgi:hypothetical protein